MTVQTLRRSLMFTALVLAAQFASAAYPPAMTGTRMAYDESTGYTVLFGGATRVDQGTVRTYFPPETWTFSGSRWIQRYPAASPEGRAAHMMTYDSARKQVVLFGGRGATADLNDTWVYRAGNWTKIDTPSAPPARSAAGMAYDKIRDRVVLFGGIAVSDDAKTSTNLYDTWEFDGTTWTKIQDNGPQVYTPQLVFDEARNQMIMVGVDSNSATLMYTFDPAAQSWKQVQPQTLPPCANESSLAYRSATQDVVLVGGVCVNSTTVEAIYSWDGTNWTNVETKTPITRGNNMALAYDEARDQLVVFGGTAAFGNTRSDTYVLASGDWIAVNSDAPLPGPRSLFSLATDPVNKVVWATGGISDTGFYPDFWRVENGGWQATTVTGAPACMSPVSAFDIDRSKLVVICQTGEVYEWDGAAWKGFTDMKTKPLQRRFGSAAYDQTLKRTVFFGGYDETNYRNDTWLWDGTAWTEQKNNRAPARSLTSMWFDPVLKKTVIYAGVGRRDPQAALERYNDMWSLGSNGWTEIKPSTLPGQRYGAQVAVDPRNNKTYLFGGLRLDVDAKGLQRQSYADDMWVWDGTNWSKLTVNGVTPAARENGAMTFDPSQDRILLFGGWGGYYLSDAWLFDSTTNSWTPQIEYTGRRRAGGRR